MNTRKLRGSVSAGAPPRPRSAGRRVGGASASPTTARVAGGISLTLLMILYWLIFYQNLPSNFGLRGAIPHLDAAAALTTTAAQADTGNSLDRFVKICTIVMSVYAIASRWSLMRSVVKYANVGAAAFLALALSSAAWSIGPTDTMLRFISLATIVLLCFAISLVGWHRHRFQQLALPPLMYILIVSLVLGMIFPEYITEIGDDLSLKNAWHGITLTKNQFGMAACLGVIICANRWLAGERRSIWTIAGAAISFACLILSRSNTSLFAAMLAVLSMVLLMKVPVIKQRLSTHLVVAIASVLLVYEGVIQNIIPGAYTLLAPIRGLTGKDASLSARTIIWDIIKEHIQAAPYLGTGYGAYWIGPVATSPSFVFTYKMYFYPTEAHNGYLDVVNDLGYAGLICVLVFLIAYMRQALQLIRTDRAQASLYLAILFQQMVMNMSESEWFARDSIFAIVLLAMTCMSRALREARMQAQPQLSPGR